MGGLTPQDVMDHALNHTGQAVLTYASWALTVVLFGVAWRLGRKERSPIYLVMVLAAMVAAFAEPLYDVMFSLWFYSDKQMDHTFTAFGIPQPVWAHSGYAILYALPAMYVVRASWRGSLTPGKVWAFAGLEVVESCVFEMVGINIGTYTYWGPHVFRVFDYPLVIGVLEAGQTITFALVACQLRHRASSPWQLLGLFWVFPVTMLGVNFGAGASTILAIHLDHPHAWFTRLAAVLSIASVAVVIKLVSGIIPPPGSRHEPSSYPTEGKPRSLVSA